MEIWRCRGEGGRTRDPRFPPLCLGSESCPGLDTAAAAAASRYPLLSAKHRTIRTTAAAAPGAAARVVLVAALPVGSGAFSGAGCAGRVCSRGLLGASTLLLRSGSLWERKARETPSSCEQQQPPAPRPASLPSPATLGRVQGAVWRWAGWGLIQSIPCLGM